MHTQHQMSMNTTTKTPKPDYTQGKTTPQSRSSSYNEYDGAILFGAATST